jgi:2-keto-3-deoxy-6-phosphogluconate aldolase
MDDVLTTYRTVHNQGFIPIFTEDGFDSKTLVEGCVQAGLGAIEYTLRCRDVRQMIPWIRKTFPKLRLLVGSTMDDERICEKMKRSSPQLMTVRELADAGVHGFVSMLRWSEENIRAFSKTHLVVPTAQTPNEAYEQICAGAHFAKLNGPDLAVLKRCRAIPAHGYCPAFVTGGQVPDRIPPTIEAGAVCVATGFDVTLKGLEPEKLTPDLVAQTVTHYVNVTRQARATFFPNLVQDSTADDRTWLNSLPHYYPF